MQSSIRIPHSSWHALIMDRICIIGLSVHDIYRKSDNRLISPAPKSCPCQCSVYVPRPKIHVTCCQTFSVITQTICFGSSYFGPQADVMICSPRWQRYLAMCVRIEWKPFVCKQSFEEWYGDIAKQLVKKVLSTGKLANILQIEECPTEDAMTTCSTLV